MTDGGWITLILAVGGVTLWHIWCMVKVFRAPKISHMSAEPTIEPDEDDEDKPPRRRK